MMRLIARHADIWNATATPDEAAELNQRLDAACAAEGRDPATLIRSISPSINLLASPDAFREGAEAYHAAGIQQIYFPWPRTEAEVPVLRAVARDILPGLRGVGEASRRGDEQASGQRRAHDAGPSSAHLQALTTDHNPRATAALGSLTDANALRVLDTLIAHPDERLDGRALMALTGIERHADVTRAIIILADAFAAHGLARPWNEAQRGYLLSKDAAQILAATRRGEAPHTP
jgi:hypothetical protein